MATASQDPRSRQTFTKSDRLLRRSDFLRLTHNGKKIQNRYLIAYTGINEQDRCRLGITVTRRVGKAAVRNRLKRIARNYFRLNRHKLPLNRDINLIAKKEAADIPNERVVFYLENLFAQLQHR